MNMKMSNLEKQFINNEGHARSVSLHAIRLLKRIPLQPNMSFLDVGTGTGATPIRVSQTYGLNATGVDIDPDQISLARIQNMAGAYFRTADATDLPFEDATFDVVATAKMTHHIPTWPEAIAEMLRVLKSGGYLVYNDIALPEWLAQAAARITNRSLPPTPYRLDALASAHELTTIYRSRVAVSYTAIWRKKEID